MTTTIDTGHSSVKAKVDLSEHEFPHLVARITKQEFDAAESSNPHRNPFVVHVRNPQRGLDGFFTVGNAATRGGQRLSREQRYSPDYAGVMLAATWALHYNEGQPATREQSVTALYPAQDSHAVHALRHAMSGNWTVRCANDAGKLQFSVNKKAGIRTVPEPMGGLFNVILDEHGNQLPEWRGGSYNPIIFDLGGGTMNVVELGAGFNYTQADIGASYAVGVNDALNSFITRCYTLGAIRSVAGADVNWMRTCLRVNRWMGRGSEELIDQIHNAIDETLNDLMDVVSRHLVAHDIFAHSHAIFSGGGSALLARPLLHFFTEEVSLPNDDGDLAMWALERGVVFADMLPEIQFANVRGAHKSRYIQA